MNNALKKLEDDVGYLRAERHRERQARDNAIVNLRAELVDRIDAVVDSINTCIDALEQSTNSALQEIKRTIVTMSP